MKLRTSSRCIQGLLLASLLASSGLTSNALAQSGAVSSTEPLPTTAPVVVLKTPTLRSGNWHAREGGLYRRNWGVDIIGVRRAAAGDMLVFRYRVLDVDKAKPLNDKRKSAYLIDEKTGVKLSVPQMEKVGLLRTTTTAKANRSYWMVFPNTGDLVKPGSRVSVVIGDFRVDGLVVDGN